MTRKPLAFTYPFPMANGDTAYFTLPLAWSAEDAERAADALRALVIPAHPRPVTSTPPAPDGTPGP